MYQVNSCLLVVVYDFCFFTMQRFHSPGILQDKWIDKLKEYNFLFV